MGEFRAIYAPEWVSLDYEFGNLVVLVGDGGSYSISFTFHKGALPLILWAKPLAETKKGSQR